MNATTPEPPQGPSSGAPFPEGERFRLLFVCTGNTCRSPLAESIARRELRRRGWKGIEVRSAGISAAPGAEASEGALGVAERHALELETHRARRLDADLVEWADLILTMSAGHLEGLLAAGAGDRATVITDFAEGREAGGAGPGEARPVRDPFGGADAEYEETYRELSRLVARVLDRLAPVVAP